MDFWHQLYVYLGIISFLNAFEIELKFSVTFGALISVFVLWAHEYFTSRSIKIITYNINDDRRIDGPIGDIFPELKKKSRAILFKHFIKNEISRQGRNCIFNFVEILPTSMLPQFQNIFHLNGYTTSFKSYCSDSKSYCFLLAWDPTEYETKFVEQIYFTESRNQCTDEQRISLSKEDLKKECMGLEFERSMPIYYIKQKFGTRQIFLGQFHCGSQNEHKKKVCNRLNEYVLGNPIKIPFVVAGDWNCFDSDKKTSEYNKEMFDEITDFSYISTFDLINQGITYTFRSYDYDMLRYMTPEQKLDFNNKLKEYESNPSENLKFSIREFLQELIEKKNDATKYDYSKTIGVENLFSHKPPAHISKSLITDMVVGWNLTKITTFAPCPKTEYCRDFSDHLPLLTIIH